MMDDSGVILLIQGLINAKIANNCAINSHSQSDFAVTALLSMHG
jgi:hypothetical protein